MDIKFRPRLTKGRHLSTFDEYGHFCLVEAVGFNVDGVVHDEHASIDPILAAMARTLNDRMCAHYSHPVAEAFEFVAPTSDICDECQARLWAVGERIAGTGHDTSDWSEAELARVHVHLALQAARAVLRLIDIADPLHNLAYEAIRAGEACLTADDDTLRGDAREAASRLENNVHSGNTPAAWAAHTAAHAARAAAAIDGDKLDDVTMTYFFANRRAREAMGYAIGAVAGDPPAAMRVARKVLNAFGKATSQKAPPVVSDEVHPDDAGAAAAEAAEPWAAEAAYREAYAEAAPVQIPTEDAVAHGVDYVAALFDAARQRAADAQYRRPVVVELDAAAAAELSDVADEAIGQVAALMSDLERAETILNAVAALHRPVAAWTRRRPDGFKIDIEYQTDCCVACRDAEGNPVPSPCPTMVALHSFGEA
jgi:hypothetical protein